MTIGTAGLGWVICDPFSLINNSPRIVGATSSWNCLYTTATYNQNVVNYTPAGGVAPTGVYGSASNSPYAYNAAPLTTGQMRLVGCALRIRYSGNEIYRGGSIVLYRQQGNLDITDGVNFGTLASSPLSAMAPVSRSWHQVNYLPDESREMEYHSFGTYWDPTQSGSSHYALLCAVQAPVVAGSATQQTYDFEAAAYYEVIGSNIQLTPSHCDPVGTGAIRTAISAANISTAPPEAQEKSILANIMNNAWEGISGAASSFGAAALEYAGSKAVAAGARAISRSAVHALML